VDGRLLVGWVLGPGIWICGKVSKRKYLGKCCVGLEERRGPNEGIIEFMGSSCWWMCCGVWRS